MLFMRLTVDLRDHCYLIYQVISNFVFEGVLFNLIVL